VILIQLTDFLKNVNILFLPSDLDVSNDTFLKHMIEFLQEGGGVGVFFSLNHDSSQIPINRVR
jgi:hypothetical protein